MRTEFYSISSAGHGSFNKKWGFEENSNCLRKEN